MSFQNIQVAFNKAIKLVPNIPTIAWPNVKFEPTNNTAFVTPNIIPGSNEVSTSVEKYKGIYQVDINVPLNKGTLQLYSIADAIKTYFQAARLVENGQTIHINEISLGTVQRDNAWYSINIDINYTSYT